MSADVFDLAGLDTALAGTCFAGKLHFLPVTGSTNSDAMAAARAGAPHGSVWFADEQTAGRGRGSHAWHSAAGEGLYVSVLLRLAAPAARMALLPFCAALAAAAAVRAAAGLAIDLRWPNDLLMDGRKTGGILVESQLGAGVEGGAGLGGDPALAFAVVGIGINVHQRAFDPALATAGTSLDLEAGRWVRRQSLLIELLKSLADEAQRLQDEAAASLIPGRVAAASSWISGRAVEVHGPQACRGVTMGLDAQGFLLVRTGSGVVTVQTGGIRAAEKS